MKKILILIVGFLAILGLTTSVASSATASVASVNSVESVNSANEAQVQSYIASLNSKTSTESKGSACRNSFGVECGNFVVDPNSPGGGAYCIPSWGPDWNYGWGGSFWKAYVAPGQYASWIYACGHYNQNTPGTDNFSDVDGLYIPANKLAVYLLWTCTGPSYAPTCNWVEHGRFLGSNSWGYGTKKLEDTENDYMFVIFNWYTGGPR